MAAPTAPMRPSAKSKSDHSSVVRERVALADAAREQAVREQVDPLGGLAPADLFPAGLALD
jgi:hypothetical protein